MNFRFVVMSSVVRGIPRNQSKSRLHPSGVSVGDMLGFATFCLIKNEFFWNADLNCP
jgi:hypothetical protein